MSRQLIPVHSPARDDQEPVEVRAVLAAVLSSPTARAGFVRDLAEALHEERQRQRELDRLRDPGAGVHRR